MTAGSWIGLSNGDQLIWICVHIFNCFEPQILICMNKNSFISHCHSVAFYTSYTPVVSPIKQHFSYCARNHHLLWIISPSELNLNLSDWFSATTHYLYVTNYVMVLPELHLCWLLNRSDMGVLDLKHVWNGNSSKWS